MRPNRFQQLALILLTILLLVGGVLLLRSRQKPSDPPVQEEDSLKMQSETNAELNSTSIPEMESGTEITPRGMDTAPTYICGILIVNKSYPLPSDYNPGLDPECEAQFAALSAAAKKEGLDIYLSSGFRSYDYQSQLYDDYVIACGQMQADTFSARPGHSEHQTGLAIDVNSISDSFADTPECAWLAKHAHEFGFIIRYPKGKEHITGYQYEPWHIRYLGAETATAVYNSGLTLEEYLGVTSCYAEE